MNRITTILRDLRDKNKRSQEYVGAKLGMSQSQYSKIEKGEKNIDMETLVKIGQIFNVPPSQLFSSIYEDKTIQFTSVSGFDVNEMEKSRDVAFYRKMAIYYENKFLKTYRDLIELCQQHGIKNYGEFMEQVA